MAGNGDVAILISCSDARLTSAIERVRDHLLDRGFIISSRGLYRITVPGPDGACLGKLNDRGCALDAALKAQIDILMSKKPAVLVIAGHTDCAGHAVSDTAHRQDVRQAAEELADAYDVPVIGLLDCRVSDEEWRLEEVLAANQPAVEMSA